MKQMQMQVKLACAEQVILQGSRRRGKQFTLDIEARDVSMHKNAFKEKNKLLVEKRNDIIKKTMDGDETLMTLGFSLTRKRRRRRNKDKGKKNRPIWEPPASPTVLATSLCASNFFFYF